LIVIRGEAIVRNVRVAGKEAVVDVVEVKAEIEVIDLVLIDFCRLMFEIRIIWKKTQLIDKWVATCIIPQSRSLICNTLEKVRLSLEKVKYHLA
jgi:hypothetical protein